MGAAAILSRAFECGGERAEGAGVSPTSRATRQPAPPETWRPSASVRGVGPGRREALREGGREARRPGGSPQAAGGTDVCPLRGNVRCLALPRLRARRAGFSPLVS